MSLHGFRNIINETRTLFCIDDKQNLQNSVQIPIGSYKSVRIGF